MNQARPDGPGIIYVLGSPRSGSTVTGDLLSALDGVQHLGGVRVPLAFGLGTIRANPRRTCGCGEPAGTCPFWSTLAVDDTASLEHRYRQILDHAKHVLDAEVVVDSSKTLRGLLLARRVGPVLGIVLCRRDLAGFLRSRQAHAARMTRRWRRLAAIGPDIARWMSMRFLQSLVSLAAPRRGVRVARTSPDTVVDDPTALLNQLSEQFLGRSDEVGTAGSRRFHTGPTHTVWGSPTRIRPDGELTITPRRPPGDSRRDDAETS